MWDGEGLTGPRLCVQYTGFINNMSEYFACFCSAHLATWSNSKQIKHTTGSGERDAGRRLGGTEDVDSLSKRQQNKSGEEENVCLTSLQKKGFLFMSFTSCFLKQVNMGPEFKLEL